MVEDIEGEPKVDREGKCFKMAEAQECGRKRQEMKTEMVGVEAWKSLSGYRELQGWWGCY